MDLTNFYKGQLNYDIKKYGASEALASHIRKGALEEYLPTPPSTYKYLINAGALNKTPSHYKNQTHLMIAVEVCNMDAIKEILKGTIGVGAAAHEVDKEYINAQDFEGNTALHLLYKPNKPNMCNIYEIVELLLEKGVDLVIKNKEGKSGYDYAKKFHDEHIGIWKIPNGINNKYKEQLQQKQQRNISGTGAYGGKRKNTRKNRKTRKSIKKRV